MEQTSEQLTSYRCVGCGAPIDETLLCSYCGTRSGKPALQYRTVVHDSNDPGYVNRLMVGTAATGLVRIEWHQARNGQTIPVNWSWVQMMDVMNSYIPLRYQVDDAQNLIVKYALEKDFQWLLLYEHDVLPPADAMVRLNEYITKASAPVVSGLYFTRTRPSEPLIFRGRGTGAFYDWKLGEKVYCDGVPTGFLLIHCGLLKLMWDESEEYTVKGQAVRQVFWTPRNLWVDPENQMWNTTSGTSDLNWCDRVIKGDYMRRAGWHDYINNLPDAQYPFLVDTNIFCRHINTNGEQFP